MDDLLAIEPGGQPLAIEHVRVLRLIRRGGAGPVTLPLRFKHQTSAIDQLVDEGLVVRGESGWPGVPGYTLTTAGTNALASWLNAERRHVPPFQPATDTDEAGVLPDR